MKPSKEYLDHIAKRLEAMNPWVGVIPGDDSKISGYKLPSLHDQMGQAAIEYMKNSISSGKRTVDDYANTLKCSTTEVDEIIEEEIDNLKTAKHETANN
jgi:hypothetical protein